MEAGAELLRLEPGAVDAAAADAVDAADPTTVRPDLQEVIDAHAYGLDESRPAATEKRHARGHRTARENVADLIDPGSLREYGALTIAAQRRRRDLQDLRESTPGDGMVAGVASVNGDLFPGRVSQTVVMAYDYSVLAGTQGLYNHLKKDRMLEIARDQRLPVVLYGEGGGGRPGDTDGPGGSGLSCLAFQRMGELSGLVPLVGIANGYCFAGNAVLVGMCDVVIATEGSNIGMGGPGHGRGRRARRVPSTRRRSARWTIQVPQRRRGRAACATRPRRSAVAKKYLAYFQGSHPDGPRVRRSAGGCAPPGAREPPSRLRRAAGDSRDISGRRPISVLVLREGLRATAW